MRMLGEMAVANPTVGSFVEYCRSALGAWAGFSVGWLYWYFWTIVLPIEATAGAQIIEDRWLSACRSGSSASCSWPCSRGPTSPR
jgi:GABA permease